MIKRITSKKQRQSVIRIAASLLLVLYVCGTSHLELWHSFVHKHEVVVTHSDDPEGDPCQWLIYHNDTDQGCVHDSHLIVSDDCQMCDLVFHGDQALLSNMEFESEDFPNVFFSLFKENLDSYWAVISSSRAPPALI